MNKRITKTIPYLFSLIFLLSMVISTSINSQAAYILSPMILDSSVDSGIMPASDDIRWRYQIKNGKLYKRLFNYTKAQWIGDWILVS